MLVDINEKIPLDNSEIVNILSGGRRSTGLSSTMLKRLESSKTKAQKYFKPRAVYEIFDTESLPDIRYFEEASQVALSICTIGDELPKMVKNLFDMGNLADGTIYDAIGSVAADAVADKVNELIDEYAIHNDLETTQRFSPGYCSWPLSGQSLFFEKLNSKDIGVKLTKSFLMLPVKSVSFGVNIGLHVKDSEWEKRCRYCKKVCSYRKEEYKIQIQ